jgi:hypothetical protein
LGWYQIRNALKARNTSGHFVPVDFSAFESTYKTFGDKLRPLVYELGFLRLMLNKPNLVFATVLFAINDQRHLI